MRTTRLYPSVSTELATAIDLAKDAYYEKYGRQWNLSEVIETSLRKNPRISAAAKNHGIKWPAKRRS